MTSIAPRFARARIGVVLALALSLTAVVNSDDAHAIGATYYLSATGSDAAPGTLVAPWRTFSHAIRSLNPGDTLLVRGGTYAERVSVPFKAATASSPTIVRAYPGERPVIKGILAIREADYWTFDGINVTWDPAANAPTDTTVKLMNGVGWTFRNAEVWGARGYANIFVGSGGAGEPASWRISNTCVHDTYAVHPPFQDHNIYVGGGVGAGIIERSILYNASNGKNIKIGGASGSHPGSGPIIVRNNTMYNASENILLAWRTHDVTIERNLMGRATGKDWYPNARGYYLSGVRNIARDNVGWSADRLVYSTDSSRPIADGGGNVFPRDPRLNSVSTCAGFHPQDSRARRYGRYGPSGVPLTGDWNGDGVETAALRTGATWRLNNTFDNSPDAWFGFGLPTDKPVVGDWNGDGIATPGVVRGNVWLINNGFDPTADGTFRFGNAGDIPVVGDWNGDGRDTPGLVRNGVWLINNGFDSTADGTFTYGHSTDVPIVGDWNGDGRDTVGLVRGNVWYLNNGFDQYADISFAFGRSSDTPVAGDWDGDGDDTPGLVRASLWYLRNTNSAGGHDVTFSDETWL